MKTRVAGATYDVNRWIVRVGGKNRRSLRWIGKVGGEIVTLASFVQPLTVTADDAYGFSINGANPITAGPTTATPTGGLGPFAYEWVVTSGTATINSPHAATTTFTKTIAIGSETVFISARVTVTDAQGTTATHTISASFKSVYIGVPV